MNEKIEISNSEWEIMRILWTLNKATSRQIITILEAKLGWKEATTKTFITRLVSKRYIRTIKDQKAYIYLPAVQEQETIDTQLMTNFDKICQKHAGMTLAHLIKNVPLTITDIERLEKLLLEKKKNAPEVLPCNCLPISQDKCTCNKCDGI